MAQQELTALYLIKQVELAVRSHLDDIVGVHGLTPPQYTALTVLERHPGMTAAELARNSFVRAQTTSQMVSYLEGRGLIERELDPRSRRQYRVTLTDAGRAVLDDLRAPVAGVERLVLAGMTREEAEQFRRSLRAVRVALGGAHPH